MSKYKGFQKIHEDEHKAVLRHPSGHEIHVSKRLLKPELKKQLSSLPMYAQGGQVTLNTAGDASRMDTGWGKIIVKNNDKPNFAKGGEAKLEGNTAGNPVSRPNTGWGAIIARNKDDKQYFPNGGMSEEPKKDDSGILDIINNIPGAATEGTPQEIQQAALTQKGTETPSEMPDAVPKPPMPKAADASPAPEYKNADIGQGPNSGNPAPISLPTQSAADATKGIETGMQGIREEGAANAKMAHEQLLAQQDLSKHLDEITKNQVTNRQAYEKEAAGIVKDLHGGHIDPNHFWGTDAAPSKLRAGIGLILGGIGGSFTGHNTVLESLNRQIDRDVDSQKADMANKYNLLSELNRQFHNKEDASNMLKSIYIQKTVTDASMAALRQGGPMAEALVKQKMMPLIQQQAQIHQNVALNQSVMKQLNGPAAGNPQLTAMAIERTSLVPEHQKAEALKQLDETQKQSQAIDHITDVMQKMDAEQTISNRIMHPIDSSRTMERLEFQVMGLAKDAFGRVNEVELEKTLKNAIGLWESPQNRQKAIELVRDNLQSKMAAPALTGNGLPMPKPKPYTPDSGAH